MQSPKMSDEAERRELIGSLLDSAVDPHPIMAMLLRHRGPGALSTETLRTARDVQIRLEPKPQMAPDELPLRATEHTRG
jgi:hypothetical protein